MKKILSIVLCLGMLFTATACNSKKVDDKAINKLETAISNLEKAKSADYTATLNFSNGVQKTDLNMYGQYNAGNEKPEVSFNVDLETDGETIKNYIGLFIQDDYVYVNMLNIMKQKTPIENVKNNEQIPDVSSVDKEVIPLSKENFKKANIKDNVISLQYDTAKINQVMPLLLKSTFNISVMDMDFTLTDDDMISNAKIQLTLTAKDADGESENMKITVDIALKNINNVKEVTFPDLSEYSEGSDMNSNFMDILSSFQN